MAHIPPEQHPPRHGELALHAVLHALVIESHACPTGQSVELLQPHLPEERQALPAAALVQSRHCWPAPPHERPEVPGSQVPPDAAVQHPEAQG